MMSHGIPIIFIAGPFRGANAWEVECNIRRAEELGYEVAKLGAMPLIPHTNTRFFNGTLTDEFWLKGTQALLSRCDAICFTDDYERSSGSREEKTLAAYLHLPLLYTVDAVKQWLINGWRK